MQETTRVEHPLVVAVLGGGMAQPRHHRGVGQFACWVAAASLHDAHRAVGINESNALEVAFRPVGSSLGFKDA